MAPISAPWLKPYHFKTGNPGKLPGTSNRLTVFLRETLGAAYHEIGGHEAFVAWAKENRTDFYCKLWIKLLPDSSQLSEDERERVLSAMLAVPAVITQIYEGEVVKDAEQTSKDGLGTTISPQDVPTVKA